MLSNHELKHGREVEEESGTYANWKLKIDNNTTIDVTAEKLITMLAGTNFNFQKSGDTITLNSEPSLFNKTTKEVNDPTYTLLESDKDKWLVFKTNCTVTVPTGISPNIIVEGEAYSNVTVTFQAGSGLVLRHVASISKTLSPNGVFGVRYKTSTDTILYGTDPTNYLNQ